MKVVNLVINDRPMRSLYVPYNGLNPAPVQIKGHKLIFFAPEPEQIFDKLASFGADRMEEFSPNNEQEEYSILSELAISSNSGVVLLPENIEFSEIIKNLEDQLPWIH